MLNGQTKIVPGDHSTTASKSATPNTAANAAAAGMAEQQGQGSNRAQDDAMVSYVFQRQNEAEFPNYTKSTAWFRGEESNLIDNNGPTDTQDLEAGFNSLNLESEGFASTKKIWGVEDKHSDDAKTLFMPDTHQWGRDTTWSSGPSSSANANTENGVLSDHAVSQPIMVKRSGFVGTDGTLMSPRSTDTGGIGMKMAEYVLNNSPSKDNLESRMHSRLLREHDKSQNVRKSDKENVTGHPANSNGLANGFGQQEETMESNKLFNRAPGIGHQMDDGDELHKNHLANIITNKASVIEGMMHLQSGGGPGVGGQPQFPDFGSDQLSSGAITGIDGLASFVGSDYVNQLMPSVSDSANLMADYYQQRNATGNSVAGQANNQLSLLSNQQQQHLNLTAAAAAAQQQNQGLAPSGTAAATIGHPSAATANTNMFTAAAQNAQNPYFAADPFSMGMLNPNAMSHYYGFHPWSVYPGIMQNATQSGGQMQGQSTSLQQQQAGRQGNNQQNAPNRPLSPSNLQNSSEANTTNPQALAALQAAGQTGFSMITLPGASGFYDQNGTLSALAAAGRGMPSSAPIHRLMPQMLQTPNSIGNGNMRMLANSSNQNGSGSQPPNSSIFASNGPNNGNGNNLYTSVTNSGMGYNNISSGTMFSANGHTNNQGLTQQQMGFHNPALGTIGASSGMNSNALAGNNSPRRDSMDGRSSNAIGGMFPNMISEANMSAFSRHIASGSLNNATASAKANGVGLNNSLGNAPFYGVGINSPGPMGLGLPGQSMTPPPMSSIEASINGFPNALNPANTYMNGMRLISNAVDNSKFLNRNGLINQNAFAQTAHGMANFNNANTNNPMNSANNGLHFNNSNGMQQVANQPSNYNNNSNNRINNTRTRSVEKNVGRSSLLEDFRNSRLPNLTLHDLNDHIVEFSQDQHGSRFIQQKLERATDEEKQLVFNEIIGQAYQLMTDVFGNYVIQKFFEFGTPTQKQALAQTIRGSVLNLALQMYGCRVIQKALESIPPDQQKEIVKELDGHVLKCVKDQNGNHVVQKCIECIEPSALQFIISAFQGQVYTLSTHPYGCRVIQRILEHCNPEQTSCILQELHLNTEQLVQDQYGNYVVQHVLEHGRPEDKSKIIQMVRGKVLNLSQHKFASNVVERCITQAMRSERAILIEEVCNYNDNALYTMTKDQYANYVVQKMIEVADAQQRKTLLMRIRPHMNSLRRFTYGKHILAKLEKYMNNNAKSSSGGSGNTGATGGDANTSVISATSNGANTSIVSNSSADDSSK